MISEVEPACSAPLSSGSAELATSKNEGMSVGLPQHSADIARVCSVTPSIIQDVAVSSPLVWPIYFIKGDPNVGNQRFRINTRQYERSKYDAEHHRRIRLLSSLDWDAHLDSSDHDMFYVWLFCPPEMKRFFREQHSVYNPRILIESALCVRDIDGKTFGDYVMEIFGEEACHRFESDNVLFSMSNMLLVSMCLVYRNPSNGWVGPQVTRNQMIIHITQVFGSAVPQMYLIQLAAITPDDLVLTHLDLGRGTPDKPFASFHPQFNVVQFELPSRRSVQSGSTLYYPVRTGSKLVELVLGRLSLETFDLEAHQTDFLRVIHLDGNYIHAYHHFQTMSVRPIYKFMPYLNHTPIEVPFVIKIKGEFPDRGRLARYWWHDSWNGQNWVLFDNYDMMKQYLNRCRGWKCDIVHWKGKTLRVAYDDQIARYSTELYASDALNDLAIRVINMVRQYHRVIQRQSRMDAVSNGPKAIAEFTLRDPVSTIVWPADSYVMAAQALTEERWIEELKYQNYSTVKSNLSRLFWEDLIVFYYYCIYSRTLPLAIVDELNEWRGACMMAKRSHESLSYESIWQIIFRFLEGEGENRATNLRRTKQWIAVRERVLGGNEKILLSSQAYNQNVLFQGNIMPLVEVIEYKIVDGDRSQFSKVFEVIDLSSSSASPRRLSV